MIRIHIHFSYELIIKAAEALEPDVVIVIDHEGLYNELRKDLPSFVKVKEHVVWLDHYSNHVHRFYTCQSPVELKAGPTTFE